MASIENNDSDEEDSQEEVRINWSNLIFLPFHPIFKMIVLCSVITKSILGPIQSVYPIVSCWRSMDDHPFLVVIKYFYSYCADPIYGIDTFLHIVHRQVTDEALKREFLPKSALCLVLDFASLIPFFRMLVGNDCPPAKFWPNILSFSETLILYRVFEYYELSTTHSVVKMVYGFFLLLFCVMNALTCFWLLLTYNGLCAACKKHNFDWRSSLVHKFNETGVQLSSYIYGMVFVTSFIMNSSIDDTRPFTIREYIYVNIFIILGYVLTICIILPKIFAETILRHRRISYAYPHVRRLVEETKRRNASAKAYQSVQNFYKIIWRKLSGITRVPDVICDLPRSVRVEIRQDLGWALFQHSPTLRKTSTPFKRYVTEFIVQDFKLPGERLFAGPHTYSNIFYIKTGVVQILSEDEGMTPILSVTSGTIFGDVSFLLPPWKRKVIINCLTYCEVMFLTRQSYVLALHKFPKDRAEIIQSVQDRLRHAKDLYARKQRVQGLDRADNEGIYWIKRRWWELSNFINNWKRTSKKENGHCNLPPEATDYHCAKYIGQLVLCSDEQLLTKSLFANTKFPWLFVPHSSLIYGWRRIVFATVILVLLLYPPFITAKETPVWFRFFQVLVDLIYVLDIAISLLTAEMRRGVTTSNFAAVMFTRCKTLTFYLDLISTLWLEYAITIVVSDKYFYIVQANRLIKIYILFTREYTLHSIEKDPTHGVLMRIVLWYFCFIYISSYFIYALEIHLPKAMTLTYFFGEKYCEYTKDNICDPGARGPLGVIISRLIQLIIYSENPPRTLADIYISLVYTLAAFIIFAFCKAAFVTAIYMRYREKTNFQSFVSNLKKYYHYYKIHADLLKRLDIYLMCHWKYYQGAGIMHPNVLKEEPYDIYWKVQGEVAERIISQSQAFAKADPGLIKDLAYSAKFLILPRNSTLFLFGVQCKMVIWVVQGYVKCEYHDEDGKLIVIYKPPGDMLSLSSVFLGKTSLRTYNAYTDIEIIYLKIQDFYKIIKQYPDEWSHLDRCIAEFSPIFRDMFENYVTRHKDYEKKIRDRLSRARISISAVKSKHLTLEYRPTLPIEHDFWTEPESDFMQYWMLFRAIIVVISILNASVQGGSGALHRRILVMIGAFCDCIAWIDIVLKMFMAYYDKKGILIYDKQKCMLHYMTRGFVLDVIGCGPWHEVINEMISNRIISAGDYFLFINTICKFAHLYILIGYLNYISNRPTMNSVYITILKLQIVMILMLFGASHYLMTFCVSYTYDDHANLVDFQYLDTCWLPVLFKVKNSTQFLHLIYAECLNFAECALVGVNPGGFVVDQKNLAVGIPAIILLVLFWYVMGYSIALLMLNSRGNTLIQHEVNQLRKFLADERVEAKLISRATAHFTYWWHRTKGINIQHLTNERIGVVFREDLSYYFFKTTYRALDTLLHKGDNLGRQLASVSSQMFMLPGEEITREMDLISSVYVVHRGKIIISKDGDVVATLGKGSVFGLLDGTASRPAKISAKSKKHSDVLIISIKQFQDIIDDDVRKVIDETPTSNNDYMATKKNFGEDPYDSIMYILRGRKTIQLPWMSTPKETRHKSWYARWLYLVWLGEPFCTALLVMILQVATKERKFQLTIVYPILVILDAIFLINLMFEFCTIETRVIGKKCVRCRLGTRLFKKFSFYIDITTLLIPLVTFFTGNFIYQLVKILRLRLLYDFNEQFCKSFKNRVGPILLNSVIILLLLHAFSCGYIIVACNGPFPLPTPSSLPESFNNSVNTEEWVYPEHRPRGNSGCARLLSQSQHVSKRPIFVVPLHWYNDYVLAVSYILLISTRVSVNAFTAVTIGQIYYEIIITYVIYIIDVWLMSMAISYIYTKYRELYLYDYKVKNLTIFLKHCGLSPVLLKSVHKYTSQLWKRQRGNWLPELAQHAPMCLREDLLCALYQHHLEAPPLLRELPQYFKRQLAARFHRVVVFPGRCIVAEGDIFPCMYFIHEGEVEKWYVDKNGEAKLMSMLTTNGYFGLIAGLFPNFAFQFSYYSRTVVDLVTLRRDTWLDLLDGYPNIKEELYHNVRLLRASYGNFGKSN